MLEFLRKGCHVTLITRGNYSVWNLRKSLLMQSLCERSTGSINAQMRFKHVNARRKTPFIKRQVFFPFVQLSAALLDALVKSLASCWKSKNKHAAVDWYVNLKQQFLLQICNSERGPRSLWSSYSKPSVL